jgi:predicted  nucleic acid-binding Zn-ribbon protein
MEIKSDNDFKALREHISNWKKQFPMFKHDIARISNIVENHIQNHSIALVHYRQTKQSRYLERAEEEIKEINRVINLAEKAQLMALLSQR